MHYFQFNIADYRSATLHLTNDEDLAYRRLLDMYYDTEAKIPIDIDWVARRIRCAPDVVLSVLNDMFERHENGYFNARCENVIAEYHAKAEQASRAGKASAERRRNKHSTPVEQPLDVGITDCQPTINYKLETINYKPITKVNTTPVGVSQSVWQDFVSHRKANKASITQTAINRIQTEAEKAGWTLEQALTECVARGWRGFKADWVKDNQLSKTGQTNQTVMSGLTRGLLGGTKNVKYIAN